MSARVLIGFAAVSAAVLLSGCTKTDTATALTPEVSAAAPVPAVIQGACPQVFLREGTAVYRTFAKGAKDDPTKIVYQASLADTTRQCVQNETSIIVTVVAQGRVVAGPAGGAGSVQLPIRVAAVDGTTVLYSELTQYPVEVPGGTAQFIFTKADVTIPAGAGADSKIFLGFDEGPPARKK